MQQKLDAKQIVKGFEKARGDRLTVEDTWQDINYYVVPRKRNIKDTIEPGDKMPYDIYDDTAIQANLVLAAGLSGYMTNASQRWFELSTRNSDLMDDADVRSFLDESQDRMYSALANSNFYQQVHECYIDLGSVGTATLYEEEDVKEDIRFFARHPKEVYAIENERGIVDMVYRCFEMTAYQAVEEFGEDKVSDQVQDAYKRMDYGKKLEFIQYVCPRHVREAGKRDSLNLPFASFWVEKRAMKMVREGGYDEFPFFVTRFYKNSGEVYGYAPGHVAYADIRSINEMLRIYTERAEIEAYPPYLVEEDSMIGTLDLRAGSVNYQKQSLSQGAAIQSMNTGGNFQIAIDYINRTEKNIKDCYFVDLFLMLTQNANMTATEVIQRTQEKMLMLGPVLGRLQTELLNPIIFRTFNILLRRGKLPRLPSALVNQELDVVYVSPLAKAQRAVQAQDMQTFLAIIGQMAQLSPEVLDTVNIDEVVDKFSHIYSVDPEVLRDKEEVEGIRQARAKQQQQQQMMMAMQQAGETGKVFTEAMKNDAEANAARQR